MDPLQAAIHALARHVLMPDAAPAIAERSAEGWYNLTLRDGRRAAIALRTSLRSDRRWGSRAVLSYDLLCRATLERDGFAFEGRAVIDVATRAFLEIEGNLTALGRVG
jgi:hypothetical protein